MNRIIVLIWKELLAVLRDAKVRISILGPPILQLFIFTFAATLDVKNVPIGILNRDNGEQGFELVERFMGSKTFNDRIYFLKGVEEIAPFIDHQKGVMVVSIDQQFSRNLDEGKPATVQLILDGRKTNTAQILAGYTGEIINQFNRDYRKIVQKVELVPRTWFNPNRIYYWYNIPCLVAILAMLTCLVVTTQSVARERELGTFDQLLVSPLIPYEILIGKIVPGIIIGLLEGLLMLAIGTLVFGVPFTGSFFLYFLSLFIFVSSISGVGLFISSLSSTQQQAMLGTFIFILPSVLLAGYATPIENMPTWLQPVTYLIPLKYMLIISKGLFLKALPARIVFEHIWPLLIISVVNFVGAGLFFRRRLQ
ncbi:MAG: ABC transporter permease [Simkaniaceae bacterium]|nr:ABC transporter permease [Simkaniaceae bacterium]MCF7852331.1 ABC transporter permease [Simkaniaceae bacterium]